MGSIRKLSIAVLMFLAIFTSVNISQQISTDPSKTVLLKTDEKAEDEKNSDEKNKESEKESGGDSTGGSCDAYVSEKEKQQCLKDREASLKTADFYTQAIMSLDPTIAEKEVSEDYIKNFSNSSVTALAYDISLFDPETIVMAIINLVISLIEMIGLFISLLVLIIYNVASSTFWMVIINTIFNQVDKVLFNWSDPNSYFMKLVFLFGILALARKLAQSKTKIFTMKTLINSIVEVVVSCMMVVFIAQYGRPIILHVENLLTTSVVQTFSFSSSDEKIDPEIENKRIIFDTLQKQGFILRHFGVVDESRISNINTGDYQGKGEGEKIEYSNADRVANLLNDPSTANAKMERQAFGSTNIAYNTGQTLQILGLSIVFGVHRLLLGILFGSGGLILIGLGLVKEVLLAISVYALVIMLWRQNKAIAGNWFASRMQWSILFMLASIIFSIMNFFINQLVIEVTKYGLLLIIVLDIILVILMKYLWDNKEEIWKKITADISGGEAGALEVARMVITGDVTPSNVLENRADRRRKEKEENDPLNDFDDKDPNRSKSSLSNEDETELADKDIDDSSEDITEHDLDLNADASEDTVNPNSDEEDTSNVNSNSDTEINTEESETSNDQDNDQSINDENEDIQERSTDEMTSSDENKTMDDIVNDLDEHTRQKKQETSASNDATDKLFEDDKDLNETNENDKDKSKNESSNNDSMQRKSPSLDGDNLSDIELEMTNYDKPVQTPDISNHKAKQDKENEIDSFMDDLLVGKDKNKDEEDI